MNSNGRSEIKKFDNNRKRSYTYICNINDNYYEYGNGLSCCYTVHQIDSSCSGMHDNIVNGFEGMEKTTLTGNNWPDHFTTKRIIVIEMK